MSEEADQDDRNAERDAKSDLAGELDRAFDARFPKKMQEKLRNAKVAVAGLGGLGSHIAVMLARSGIGKLRLVDFDVVDVTNLNRQMYLIPQLGKPKPEALLEILYQINPYAVYEPVCVRVTPENVKELFEDYPIVCEAFDRPDQKAMAGPGGPVQVSGDHSHIGQWDGWLCGHQRDPDTAGDAETVCVR